MKIFLVAALFALVIYPSSAVPVFEKRQYASRFRAAADGVVEEQETGGAGVFEVREEECPSGTCNVIDVPPLGGGFYNDVGGYLAKLFQNIGDAATPALIAKIINREIIRKQNRAKKASSKTKVIEADVEVGSSGTKITGAPNNNADQPSSSRWITVNSDRVALQSTFTRRVPVLYIPRGAEIGDIRESDIPKFTVPLSFLTTFNRTPKIAPAPVSLKPASGPASWEPYKVPQRTRAAPSPWETSKVPGQPSFVILDDSDNVSEEPVGDSQPANSGPTFVILQNDEDDEDISQLPNKKADGLIYIKPENPRKPVKDIAQAYGAPPIFQISAEENPLPHKVYDRPVLPPARSSIPRVSNSRLSVPKSKLPITNRDGTRVTKRKSRQPDGTRVTKTKYRLPDGTRVTETKSRQPDGTRVTKTKFRRPDGTRVTKTKSRKPDGTRVTKTKSRKPDGTRVTKTKSRQPDGTSITKTKSRRPGGTRVTQTKSQEPDGSRVTRTTSEQPDGTRVTKIDNSDILDETVIVSDDDVTAIDFLEDGQKAVNEQDSILISKDGKLLQGAKDGREIKITQKDGITIVDLYDDSDDDETILTTDDNDGGQSTNQVAKLTTDRNVVKKSKVVKSDQRTTKRSVSEINKSKMVKKRRDTKISKSRNSDETRLTKTKSRQLDSTRDTKTKSRRPDGTRVTRIKSQEPDGSRVRRTTSQQPGGTRDTKIDNSDILDETVIVSNDDVTAIDFLEDGQTAVNEKDSILISKDGKLLQGAKDGREIKITQKDGVTIVDLYDDSDDDETILRTDENDGGQLNNQVTKSTTDRNVVKKSKVIESDQRTTKRSDSQTKKLNIVKKGTDTKISKAVTNDVNISKRSKYSSTNIQRPNISPAHVEGSRGPYFAGLDSNESEEVSTEDNRQDTDDETVLTANGNVSIDIENEGSILVKKDGSLVRQAGDKRDVVVKKVGDDIEVDIWDDDDDPNVEGYESRVYVDPNED